MTAAASDSWIEQARAVQIEDELARRGFKYKRSGKELIGPCPRCGGDDRFGVNIAKQVFNCRGCGAKGDVIDLVQHIDGSDFTAACTTLIGQRSQTKSNGEANGRDEDTGKQTKVVVGKWRYEDEAGKLLFGVKRVEYQYPDGSFVLKDGKHKKDFIPCRIDPRSGEWVWRLIIDGVPDVRIVPYRLPELIEAICNGYFVVIVEGEHKVELLREWGIPATCNAGGAGKWKAEHSAFLQGADVVILPDNDERGRKHRDVVGAALQGIAASIRVLELELPPKGDVIDWAKAGGTVEQLDDLIAREAKPWAAQRSEAAEDEFESEPKSESKLEPIRWLDMSNWDNEPRPERKWAIRDRVPLNQAGLFSGEGGTGKSIIEMMKDVAHVTAKDWLGSLPEPGPAWYLGAEDDQEEIHIRFYDIAAHYGVTFKELIDNGLKVLCQLGEDATLCAAGKSGKVETTALYRQLYEAAGDLKPKNISIDTLSRAFAGNEIDRVQVYAFAMHMQALAMVARGSVTVLSHPSLQGIASGSGISGSTAWHGAFRFRQYLKSAPKNSDDEQPDDGLRQFEFKKNQYGPIGETIVLRYQRGLFLPVAKMGTLDKLAAEQAADHLFLDLLDKFQAQGRNASHIKTANSYAPTMFAKDPKAKAPGIHKTLAEAMERLFAAKKIKAEEYGPPSKRYHRVVRCGPQQEENT